MTDPNTPAPKGEHDGDEPVTEQSDTVQSSDSQAEHDGPREPAVAPEDRAEAEGPGAQDPAAAAAPDTGAPSSVDEAPRGAAEPVASEPAAVEPDHQRYAPAAPEPAEPAVAPEDRPVPALSQPTSQVPTSAPATGALHDDRALRAAEAARSDAPSDPSLSAPVAPGSAPAPSSDDLDDTRLTGAGAGAAATSSTAAWTPPPAPTSPTEYAAPAPVTTPTPYAPPTQAMPTSTSTTPISSLGTSPAESLGFTDGIAGGDDGFTAEEVAQRRQFRDEMAFRQKQEFGGINFGAGFFGWLAAAGLAGLLYLIVGGIAAVSGFAQPSLLTGEQATVKSFGSELSAQTLQITALVVVLVVLFLSYFVGGFVAGRMARFSGLKQGLAVWLWGLFMSIIAAVVVIVVASQSATVSALQDRMDPVTLQTFTSVEALIAEGLIVLLSIGGALLGGLAGMSFHKKVDRFAVEEV